MLRFRVGTYQTVVEGADASTMSWLDTLLSVPIQHAKYTSAYAKGLWDGRKHFLSRGRFLSGFLPFVLQEARASQRPYCLLDERPSRRVVPSAVRFGPYQLRERLRGLGMTHAELRRCLYQLRAGRVWLTQTLEGLPWPRGVLEMATGSGKTITAACLIARLREPTLYIVPSLSLLYQTRDELQRFLQQTVGVIGDSQLDVRSVTVSTIQTASRLARTKEFQKYLKTVNFLIYDEAHLVTETGEWIRLVQKTPAYYLAAFTGTALRRGDVGDASLIGHFGDVVYRLRHAELAALGLAAGVSIYVWPVTEPKRLQTAPWSVAYQLGVVENEVVNDFAAKAARLFSRSGLATLILVRYRRHGMMLRDLLQYRYTVKVRYIDRDSSVSEREEVKRAMARGERFVVVSTSVLDVGVDLPDLRAIILLVGGKSDIKTIQRIGRGARKKYVGNNRLIVLDFIHRTNKHLLEHSHLRRAVYQEQQWPVQDISGLQDIDLGV